MARQRVHRAFSRTKPRDVRPRPGRNEAQMGRKPKGTWVREFGPVCGVSGTGCTRRGGISRSAREDCAPGRECGTLAAPPLERRTHEHETGSQFVEGSSQPGCALRVQLSPRDSPCRGRLDLEALVRAMDAFACRADIGFSGLGSLSNFAACPVLCAGAQVGGVRSRLPAAPRGVRFSRSPRVGVDRG